MFGTCDYIASVLSIQLKFRFSSTYFDIFQVLEAVQHPKTNAVITPNMSTN